MLFVDTNIFLEFLLEQEKSGECKLFLQWAKRKSIPLICSQFSIHAIEANLSDLKKQDALKKFLENLLLETNLSIYPTSVEEEIETTIVSKREKLDFDDALQYFVAKKNNCEAIVSLDKHFDKTGLARKTPAEILENAE